MPVSQTTTSEELSAVLTRRFSTMTPAGQPLLNAVQFLNKHRKLLLSFREKGFTPEQIATVLRDPEIGVNVSPSMVGKALKGGAPKKAPVKYTATIPLTIPPPAGSLIE